MNHKVRLLLFTVLLAVLTTACKFFFGPSIEWSGFSPVIAIALFSGFIIDKKDRSFLLPLLALLLSDVLIQLLYMGGQFKYPGFYSGQWLNYLLLLSASLVGWLIKGKSYGSLLAGALIAPTVYFLLSNFAVWAGQELMYSKDFNGLLQAYTAGLPFYKNSLLASVVFLPVAVLAYNQVTSRKTSLVLA